MANADTNVLDRLVGVIPKQYRQEVTRFAGRVRDRLPPVVIEHRMEALREHFDRRLNKIETKIDKILQLLENRST